MKYIIIGRTATGKTALANALAKKGLSVLKTTTTRPQRSPADTDHIFITQSEADTIPEEQKLLKTVINNAEYFTRIEDLNAADVCILDPSGYDAIIPLFPEESLHIVYTTCEGAVQAQKDAVVNRADDPVAALAEFNQRQIDESETFSQFEKSIASRTWFSQSSVLITHFFKNDFTQKTLDKMADLLIKRYNCHENLKLIAEQLLETGDAKSVNKDGRHVDVTHNGDKNIKETVSIDIFADIMQHNTENFTEMVMPWLALRGAIGLPDKVNTLRCQQAAYELSAEPFDEFTETPEIIEPDQAVNQTD